MVEEGFRGCCAAIAAFAGAPVGMEPHLQQFSVDPLEYSQLPSSLGPNTLFLHCVPYDSKVLDDGSRAWVLRAGLNYSHKFDTNASIHLHEFHNSPQDCIYM